MPKTPDLTLEGHKGSVNAVAIFKDNKRFLTGSWDKTAIIWDAVSGQPIHHFTSAAPLYTGNLDSVWAAAIIDETKIVTGSWPGHAFVWDVQTSKAVHMLKGHARNIWAVVVSPDGTKIVTGSADETAISWDAVTGEQLKEFKGHEGAVTSLAVFPDSSKVWTGSVDKSAILWDLETGEELERLHGVGMIDRPGGERIENKTGHSDAIYALAVFPDGRKVITCGEDWTRPNLRDDSMGKAAICWDPACANVYKDDANFCRICGKPRKNPNPDLGTGIAIVWGKKERSMVELLRLKGHKAAIRSVAVFPDGRKIITGSKDKTAIVWDGDNGSILQRLKGHSNAVWSVAVFENGRKALTGCGDSTSRVYEIMAGFEPQAEGEGEE